MNSVNYGKIKMGKVKKNKINKTLHIYTGYNNTLNNTNNDKKKVLPYGFPWLRACCQQFRGVLLFEVVSFVIVPAIR